MMRGPIERFAYRHERLFLSTFLLTCIAVAAWACWEAYKTGERELRITLLAAWSGGVAFAIVQQVVLWRRGRLIVRDVAQREANREQNRSLARLLVAPAIGLSLIAGIVLGDAKAVVLALFGSLMLGYAPVLLWIAFVLRPDQEPRAPG
jgi:hypothetical protein